MDISQLWQALHGIPEARVNVIGTVINPSGIVAFLSGTLEFQAGTLDQLKPNPRPDVLHGTTTWLFSDRMFKYGTEFGFGGETDRLVRFDPDGPMLAGLTISRSVRLVEASVEVSFGSTSFWLEQRDGLYVGDATAIGGTEPHLYALAFPHEPTSGVVP
ncbi:MAG: hypothetical protein ACOYBY_06605 [Dermatophilaceae bacterium]